MTAAKTTVLMILDGWGYRPEAEHNPIMQTDTPFIDGLFARYPYQYIEASGGAVGLPAGQMGNSEVGHLHIGAGRVVEQDLTRIHRLADTGGWADLSGLQLLIEHAKRDGVPIHVMGLLSDGGVHSHIAHIQSMMDYLGGMPEIKTYCHAVLDGRDTPPQSAAKHLLACDFPIYSIIGRYYAMDRDQRWERTQLAYDLYIQGQAQHSAGSALAALEMAYARGETDEFVQSTRIAHDGVYAPGIEPGDIVLMMNFRSDRFRQLAYAFTQPMPGMKSQPNSDVNLATLSAYSADLKATVLVTKPLITETLGACVATAGLRQLRIAETEKYAHVTYFINGGREAPFAHEDRVLIPSPQVATYDLQPEMSAEAVTDALVEAITNQTHALIICNYANPDMVGHTGNFQAAKAAVQVMDACLARVVTAIESVGGQGLMTADHGNIELMYDVTTDQPHTAHTSHLVPLLYVGKGMGFVEQAGSLVDIAPTVLRLLGLSQPSAMTGQPLLDSL